MKWILIFLLIVMITACMSNTLQPTITADRINEPATRYPRWLYNFPTSCEYPCNFPREECILISVSYFVTLSPEENPTRFLEGLRLEVDGQPVAEDNRLIIVDLMYYGPVSVCFNTSQLSIGSHIATIGIQLEDELEETYSWEIEIESIAP